MVTAAVEASDVVIIWGCGDTCPILGNATKTGSSTTPAGKGIEVVRPIRDEIRRRVEQLITELQPQRPATRHYIGDGAAAGWTTLGAGRRASVGGLCDKRVQQRVADWPARLAAAAAHHGDTHLGTLANAIPSCIAAVGPGAALAAARPEQDHIDDFSHSDD